MQWCRLDDIVVTHRRIVHRKAIVVLGGDDQVAHPGLLNRAHPLVGIELHRVEFLDGLAAIDILRDFANTLNVFGVAADRFPLPYTGKLSVDSPVHETAKTRLTPPCQPRVASLLRRSPPGHLGGVRIAGELRLERGGRRQAKGNGAEENNRRPVGEWNQAGEQRCTHSWPLIA
jgi:hypothetical protein